MTITGTNFAAGATVNFGTAAATNGMVANGTSITATTPAGTAGAVTVAVTEGGRAGVWRADLPSGGADGNERQPNNGTAAGGTAVTITGTNFSAGATVTFGATAATNVVVASGTSITATTPARKSER